MTGRPHTCDEQTTENMVNGITITDNIERACTHAGISPRTYHAWRKRGRTEQTRINEGKKPQKKEAPFLHFLQETSRARDNAIIELEEVVRMAALGSKDWRAAEAILKRRAPKEWAQSVQVSGPDGGPVEIAPPDWSSLPKGRLDRLRKLLLEEGGDDD